MQSEEFYAYNTYLIISFRQFEGSQAALRKLIMPKSPHKSLCLAYVDRNETDT